MALTLCTLLSSQGSDAPDLHRTSTARWPSGQLSYSTSTAPSGSVPEGVVRSRLRPRSSSASRTFGVTRENITTMFRAPQPGCHPGVSCSPSRRTGPRHRPLRGRDLGRPLQRTLVTTPRASAAFPTCPTREECLRKPSRWPAIEAEGREHRRAGGDRAQPRSGSRSSGAAIGSGVIAG